MLTFLVVMVLAADPLGIANPLNLDTLTVDRAKTFQGKPAAVTFMVAKPTYTLRGFTIVGASDWDDVVERAAVIKGSRLDIDVGKRLTVVGIIQVIRHRADVVNGVIVPAWFEIRVTVN